MKQIFAIFGDPVSHSHSPLMHNSVFKHLHFDASYTRVHLKDGSQLRETFLKLGLSGANVTVPHKEAAFQACDEIRGFAKKIGIVNTIVLQDNKLIGYNTDADGFVFAIEEFKQNFPQTPSVLVIGAGGTAKALAEKLTLENFNVSVLNRSSKSASFFQQLGIKFFTWDNFVLNHKYDLLVNTTSAGLKDEELPAPKEMLEEILEHTTYAADAIYGKLTPFLQLAKSKNITYKDGADMLLGQGVLANELFVKYSLSKQEIFDTMKHSFDI